VKAFRVLRESAVGSRFEALRTGETPLIGRNEELELLGRRWAEAKAGRGQVVLISAEPGIGKSRRVIGREFSYELIEQVAQRAAAELRLRARHEINAQFGR
jgi:hypothetical protein